MSFFSPSGSYLKDARSNTPRVQNEPVSAPSVAERPRVTDSSGRDVTNTTQGRAASFLKDFIMGAKDTEGGTLLKIFGLGSRVRDRDKVERAFDGR